MKKYISKKAVYILLISSLVIITAVAFVIGLKAASDDKTQVEEPDESITYIDEKNVVMQNESAIVYEPSLSEEDIKLHSLEKSFLDSEYYRKEGMIPLTVTGDYKYFVAYKIRNESRNDENALILTGMPRQSVDLYLINLAEKKSISVGKTEFVISHAWSEDGKMLSLVSFQSVKILDIATGKLTEVPLAHESNRIYNTNWGSDHQTLYIHLDTIANYYAYNLFSKSMVKIRGSFEDGDIVYRGSAGRNILTSKGERVGAARGLYSGAEPGTLLYNEDAIIHDINGSSILVSHNGLNTEGGTRYTLEDCNTVTGETRILYSEGNGHSVWKIYKASYLKMTGDAIYTTFEAGADGVKYHLVRITPDGNETVIQVPSPLYTLTPGENLLHFAVFKNGESCLMDLASFQFVDDGNGQAYENEDIRDFMFRVINIYQSEIPDLEEINQIFINSYDPIPQEALENILLEAEDTNSWRYNNLELGKSVIMSLKMKDNQNRASIVLEGQYFRGPHELVKKEGKWYVTGLSTWPESKIKNDVHKACIRYIENEIKTGKVQSKIPTEYSKIEIGEIELWSMSDPHRAVSPDAKEARVKIIVTLNDGSTGKYQAYFSRRDIGTTWKCQSLGELSPGLFPR